MLEPANNVLPCGCKSVPQTECYCWFGKARGFKQAAVLKWITSVDHIQGVNFWVLYNQIVTFLQM